MLFIKSMSKKKNFKGYMFSIFMITLGLMIFNLMYIKIDTTYNNLKNQLMYRTIYISEKIDFKNIDYIDSYIYDENSTIVVVKEYNDIQKLINTLNKDTDYEINIPDNENKVLFYSIKILIYTMYIALIIISLIYIIQFINDDIKTIKILRRIGYNKLDIIYRYLTSLLSLYTIIFLISLAFAFVIITIFNNNININNVMFSNCKIYIINIILIVILIHLKIISLPKNKI